MHPNAWAFVFFFALSLGTLHFNEACDVYEAHTHTQTQDWHHMRPMPNNCNMCVCVQSIFYNDHVYVR